MVKNRHRDHPIGHQHGLLALQGIDGIEGVRIRGEDLIQSFPQILQHMKAVRDLDGCGCALACTRIRTRPIPGDDLHPGMRLEPLGDSLSGMIRQECHGLPALQVHQDRATGVPFPQGEIVHPEHPGCGQKRQRQLPSRRGRCSGSLPGPTGGYAPRCCPPGHAEGAQRWASRRCCPGGGHRRQPFGEDAAVAAAITKPLADAELKAHAVMRPREVSLWVRP